MKQVIDNQTVQELAGQLRARIAAEVNPRLGDVRLWGVPRGGTIAAHAVAGGVCQVVETPEDAHVIIDDILDSGATARKYAHLGRPFGFLTRKAHADNLVGLGRVLCPSSGVTTADRWVVFPWEQKEEAEGAEENFRRILQAVGENPDREGLLETPKRFIKALRELTAGYGEDPEAHLHKAFDIQDVQTASLYDQLILSRDLPFYSLCEHHVLPFHGVAHIAYIPSPETKKVVGLSKLARVLDGYARRLQVQERLTTQIADAIEKVLQPLGVAVIVRGHHSCQCSRGVRKGGAMVTSALHGVFRTEATARAELFQLIAL